MAARAVAIPTSLSLEEKCALMRANSGRLPGRANLVVVPDPEGRGKRRVPDGDPKVRMIQEYESMVRQYSPMCYNHCSHCRGVGVVASYNFSRCRVCGCVWRKVFRSCFGKYKSLDDRGMSVMRITIRGISYTMPGAEFRADFEIICRRTISELSQDSGIVKDAWYFYHMMGLDWKWAVQNVNHYHPSTPIDRGNFFHYVHKIEQICGRALYETKPFGLYPSGKYFAGGRVV